MQSHIYRVTSPKIQLGNGTTTTTTRNNWLPLESQLHTYILRHRQLAHTFVTNGRRLNDVASRLSTDVAWYDVAAHLSTDVVAWNDVASHLSTYVVWNVASHLSADVVAWMMWHPTYQQTSLEWCGSPLINRRHLNDVASHLSTYVVWNDVASHLSTDVTWMMWHPTYQQTPLEWCGTPLINRGHLNDVAPHLSTDVTWMMWHPSCQKRRRCKWGGILLVNRCRFKWCGIQLVGRPDHTVYLKSCGGPNNSMTIVPSLQVWNFSFKKPATNLIWNTADS